MVDIDSGENQEFISEEELEIEEQLYRLNIKLNDPVKLKVKHYASIHHLINLIKEYLDNEKDFEDFEYEFLDGFLKCEFLLGEEYDTLNNLFNHVAEKENERSIREEVAKVFQYFTNKNYDV